MSVSSPSSIPPLTIQFMDAGQGDATYVEFPDGTNMLVDFGSTKNKDMALAAATKFLRTTRLVKQKAPLHYLVLTHPDRDHYNGVEKLLTDLKVPVLNLLYGGNDFEYGTLITGFLRNYKPSINEIQAPNTFPSPLGNFKNAEVWVLAMNAPSSDASDKNTSSVVLRITYNGESVMLCGDATFETEQFILNTFKKKPRRLADLKTTVLKVGHHGSARTSVRPSFITAVQPEYVFISSDRFGTGGSGLPPTGHRLPQELCIDIIRNNTKLATAGLHHYFSWYDPDEYTRYRNPDTGIPDMPPPTGGLAEWVSRTTTEAIFTSLGKLGLNNNSEADEGVQYQVTIGDRLDISST